MGTEKRGFASMDRSKQLEIARRGGIAAQRKGTAHRWTSDEARVAGRKGGLIAQRHRHNEDPDPGTFAVAVRTPHEDDEVSRFADEGNPHA